MNAETNARNHWFAPGWWPLALAVAAGSVSATYVPVALLTLLVTVGSTLAAPEALACISGDNKMVSSFVAVPESLSERLFEFEVALVQAKQIVQVFARENGLPPGTRLEGARLEVYPSQEKLWRCMNRTPDWSEPPPLPRKTFVAANGNPLRAVTPEEFARVIPEYAALRRDAWVRLIAHELAHNWHAEVASRKMGPHWFFEGLAVVIANQGFGEDLHPKSADDALQPIDWSGRYAYAQAAASVRFFLKRAPVKTLIERAQMPDFETWLRKLPAKPPKTPSGRL